MAVRIVMGSIVSGRGRTRQLSSSRPPGAAARCALGSRQFLTRPIVLDAAAAVILATALPRPTLTGARTMLATLLLLSIGLPFAPATSARQDPNVELAPEVLEGLVEALAKEIEQRYVFPDVAHAIGALLREQLFAGAYEGTSLAGISARLTQDLRSVNDDRHLSVWPIEPRAAGPAPDPAQLERERADEARRSNFGFQKVEILEGNV